MLYDLTPADIFGQLECKAERLKIPLSREVKSTSDLRRCQVGSPLTRMVEPSKDREETNMLATDPAV